MTKILDGKKVANSLKQKLKKEINELPTIPKLTVIQVGNIAASNVYIHKKKQISEELGLLFELLHYDNDISTATLIKQIRKLNIDTSVNGILIQLPLPSHIDSKKIIDLIDPLKDVDGLTSTNLGKLFKNNPSAIPPATAKGVIELLKRYDIEIEGKQAVVVGRGDISGLPIAGMLQNENATVTLCHSYSKDLKNICKRADILVVSIGKAQYINREYIKEGCVVIDVGTNRDVDGKLVGDVDFKSIKDMAGSVTPVPGGIGPMTIACLFSNLLNIYKQNV